MRIRAVSMVYLILALNPPNKRIEVEPIARASSVAKDRRLFRSRLRTARTNVFTAFPRNDRCEGFERDLAFQCFTSVAPPRFARPATPETGVQWHRGVRHGGHATGQGCDLIVM